MVHSVRIGISPVPFTPGNHQVVISAANQIFNTNKRTNQMALSTG